MTTYRATFETAQGFPVHVLLRADPDATVAELHDAATFTLRSRRLKPVRCVALVRWPITPGTRRALLYP